MAEKRITLPGPDHPIRIERNPSRVIVSVAGRIIADTRDALTLREAAYAPVQYVPRKDVALSLLKRTDHATYCPYKGDCAYWSNNPTSYSYAWRRCKSKGMACTAITGATSQSYTLTAADVGSFIRVAVTASNAGGSSTAVSFPTAAVT